MDNELSVYEKNYQKAFKIANKLMFYFGLISVILLISLCFTNPLPNSDAWTRFSSLPGLVTSFSFVSIVIFFIGLAMRTTAREMFFPKFKIGEIIKLSKGLAYPRVPMIIFDPELKILSIESTYYLVSNRQDKTKQIPFGPAHDLYKKT